MPVLIDFVVAVVLLRDLIFSVIFLAGSEFSSGFDLFSCCSGIYSQSGSC